MSGTDQQRRQNSSKASLGLAFRETRNALLTHVMSQSGDEKAANYKKAKLNPDLE
jgi:hypothetical protein